jgi:suppressor for copper-sensitivity B
MIKNVRISNLLLLAIFLVASQSSTTLAQELFLQDQFGDLTASTENLQDPVSLSGEYKLKTGTRLGVLNLTADIADNWHLYSLTQPKGGPIRSTIQVRESDQYQVIGPFQPDNPPHITPKVEGFDVPVEDHETSVTWSAPIQLAEGVDAEQLTIDLVFDGQTCYTSDDGQLGSCKLIRNEAVAAGFAGYDAQLKVAEPKAEKKAVKFRPKRSHVELSGRVVRAGGANQPIQPGDKITFELTAKSDDQFHVYAFEHRRESEAMSTLVVFVGENIWKVLKPRGSKEPELNLDPEYEYHEGTVTWAFDLTVPDDAEKKNYKLTGLVGFQTCTKSACDPPGAAEFTFVVPVGSAPGAIPVEFADGSSYSAVEKAIKSVPANSNGVGGQTATQLQEDTPEKIAEMATYYDPEEKVSYLTLSELEANPIGTDPDQLQRRPKTTLWTALLGAFIGGMILNLMPCVFPVLGLKVMGFCRTGG